jgi:hypothetical protein
VKWLLVLSVIVVLVTTGCGSGSRRVPSVSQTLSQTSSQTPSHAPSQTSSQTTTEAGAPARVAKRGAAKVAPGQRYLNDGDHDQRTDEDKDDVPGNDVLDEDKDAPEDHMHPENNRYHDKDDGAVVNRGHAADAADRRAVTEAVKRYYRAAVAYDGAQACAMLLPSLAKSLPETYAQVSSPAYLRGLETCPAIMTKIFRHSPEQLTNSFVVTGVRIVEGSATALLGSTVLPASSITLAREGSAWRISELLGMALE